MVRCLLLGVWKSVNRIPMFGLLGPFSVKGHTHSYDLRHAWYRQFHCTAEQTDRWGETNDFLKNMIYKQWVLRISMYMLVYRKVGSFYLSISIDLYLYLCPSISIYLYLSLSISIYLYRSLSISIYLYRSLSISIYIYLYLSISIYIYLYLSISI